MYTDTLQPSDPVVVGESYLNLLVDRAFEFMGAQQWDFAYDVLREAVELAPDLMQLHEALGTVCYRLNNLSEAIQAYGRALDLAPNNPDVLVQVASVWLHAGCPDKAEPLVHRARQAGADDKTVREMLVRCRISAASHGKARALSPQAGLLGRDAVLRFYDQARDKFSDVCPPELRDEHLRNSRILPSRDIMLDYMPKGAVCAEVGTQTGMFAKKILQVMQPEKFHIYDIDFTPFDFTHFMDAIENDVVELHVGDSAALLGAMPDKTFDYIYIDAEHGYAGVAADLAQAALKIKDDGWIMLNDYTLFSSTEKITYGVPRAVNELCLTQGFEIIYLGLQCWGYHDVAVRRIGATPSRNSAR